MKERLEFIRMHQTGRYTVTHLAEQFQVSRKTAYKWLARFSQEGVSGLGERSRAPHRRPNATPTPVALAVLRAEAARLNNALIEVFAIHLRNLIDFLYLVRPQQTDVVAADFCATDVWEAVKPRISISLEAARVRANKEVAHLTSRRIAGTPPGKEWDPRALAAEIRLLLQLFVAKAEATRLSPDVAAAIR